MCESGEHVEVEYALGYSTFLSILRSSRNSLAGSTLVTRR
jgi:hypothetical protein